AGALISWISGAMISGAMISGAMISGAASKASRPDGKPSRPGARRRRIGLQLLGSGVAVLATVYLVVDRTRLLDLVIETWKHGPAPR
ncbi:MAG: hypothetical protein H6Q90_2737, partial [Deltaproteobacteria bacterium]|nr:hypothetical protein [Deltaproteobacteria bacterium]